MIDIHKKISTITNGLNIDYDDNVEFFVKILEKLVVGILILNLEEVVLYVNEKYSEITDTPYEDIVLKKVRTVRPESKLVEVVKTGNEMLNSPRKIGDKKYFVDLAPIRINGKIVGGITIMKDFEDVKIMAKQLKYFENKVNIMKSVISNQFHAKYTFNDIIFRSDAMYDLINIAKKISLSNASVLITGNTGTGKELFAQSIHNHSERKNKPFIPINCASIPNTLIESELFGYTSGAFTGSTKEGKIGLLELADNGTIFLDEIENMDLEMQNKILRVLEEKNFRKIGSNNFVDIDVRIISATNKNIETMIKENKFREDLYYRLCIMPLYIPNLSERKEDIKVLTDYYLALYNKKYSKDVKITNKIYNIFWEYEWPGNVRELRNELEYLVNISEDTISVNDLRNKMKKTPAKCEYTTIKEYNEFITLKENIEKFERSILEQCLAKYGSSVESKLKIAETLGISISSLYNKLREYYLL